MTVDLIRLDADTFTDWQPLLDLIKDAFAFMDGRIDPPSSAQRLTVETLREKALVETAFIAVEQGKLLGCIFCRAEENTLYVGKLAVSPQAQGKGIGRMLLDAAATHARLLALPALRLEARIELTENHAIFGRWGFVKTAENAHAGYSRTTSIEMRKVL